MNKYNETEDITIIIKTFERKKSLIKLLKSIDKQNQNCKIAIADDSKVPYKEEILTSFPQLNIAYYELPFDSGLSIGRNHLIGKIETKYFLLCDDDFRFDRRTNLRLAREILEARDVDILSGCLFNYIRTEGSVSKSLRLIQGIFIKGFLQTFVATITIHDECLQSKIKTRVKDDFVYADMVHNFFLANVKSVNGIGGWDEKLKLSEHGEFFVRAKSQGLKIGHSSLWGVRHYPETTKAYKMFRERDYDIYAFNKLGLKLWIDEIDNGSTFRRVMKQDYVEITRVFHKSIRGYIRKIFYITRKNKIKISRKQ